MNWATNKKKIVTFTAAFAFTVVGTYNAVVINAGSSISGDEIKFVKRLDEVYGVVKPGRMVANSVKWQKLKTKKVAFATPVVQIVQKAEAAVVAPAEEAAPSPAAAVQEELSLNLVEVINTTKWQQGLASDQFRGNLQTRDGIIENLDVSLPNDESISVSYSEMTGNVFEYDLNGELYSGMMYQVDQHSYMVTLSNGPLEGTRLRFTSGSIPEQQEQDQQNLAETHHVEAGSFGQEEAPQAEEMVMNDQALQQEAVEAQSFNF